MKQKNCIWAVAATMLLAAASFTSCYKQDNVIYPEPETAPDYSFDEGSLIINGQCESSDVSNFFVQVGEGGAATNGAIPATIKWDEETPKNHCIIVDIRSEAEARAAGNAAIQVQWWAGNAEVFAAHDTQFFISFGEENALNAKDQIRVTMDIKADEAFTAGTGAHAAPGSWLSGAFGNVNFTEEWTEFDSGWVTVSDNGPKAGAYSIAFDMATGEANRAFFDNIRVEVKRADPDPELIDGYQVIFWNWGVAKEDQLSVKYFKNYVAPTAEDGAIVVQSLEPGKNYNDKYYMANDQGQQIDAVLTNDWDTQFLISLPKPLEKGTKGKLVMKVKADKAASAGTQCHKAIPAPGAIEGKDGYAGTYQHWAFMGNVNFTTEWQTLDIPFTVPDQGDGVQSICLNLEGLREAIKYYFDNITVYVEKEWEPEAEEGWDIVTWTAGKNGNDATKFQVKYFKNYTTAKSVDGAIVVESLDPSKNYNGTYYMADDDGNQIDATLARDWDTQFLIGLPSPYAVGTKFKVSMLIKADKAANANSQTHGALPTLPAIEGQNGYKGTYKHWALMGDVAFTTDWKQYESGEQTLDNNAQEGWQSVCFNLDVLREVNKYYFKNIVVKIKK